MPASPATPRPRFAPTNLASKANSFDPEHLHRLAGRHLLVVGDIILDRYVWGEVGRISPEAPVPVVLQSRISDVLGGGMNVARNVVAAGGKALMVGVIGDDEEGRRILELMAELGLNRRGVIADAERPTVLKTRIMSGGQQLLRLDREKTGSYSKRIEKALIQAIKSLLPDSDGVIISDYRKGVVTRGVVQAAVESAHRLGLPVVVDPKATDFRLYLGADYLTPNLKEASEAAGATLNTRGLIVREGRKLIRRYKGRGIVITRGHEGLSLIAEGEPLHIAARAREVFDVTGAGDTFTAHFMLGLTAGFSPAEAAGIGNAAAGVAVSKLGAVTVSPQELASAMGGPDALSKIRTAEDLRLIADHLRARRRRIVFTNGCFDLFHAGHVQLLHEARALGDVLIVALNTDRSVRRIKGPPRPVLPARERAAVLSALADVDYVVFFDEDTPARLLSKLHPDVLVKGMKQGETIIGANIVRNYGGEIVELPLFEASTTGELVRKIRRSPRK